MVVEFDQEEDADYAIKNSIVFRAQIFNCECQKYEHIETHCKAQETCGYCVGLHSTKACLERDKPGSQPICPNYSKNHLSWSIQCEDRKEELARIEERRMNMPYTYKEAALRRGNFTGKPKQSRETHRGAKENSQATGVAATLNAPGNQKRGRSPRKITRIDGNQGTDLSMIRKILTVLQYNVNKSRERVMAPLLADENFQTTIYHLVKDRFDLVYNEQPNTQVCFFINSQLREAWTHTYHTPDLDTLHLQFKNGKEARTVHIHNIYNPVESQNENQPSTLPDL
ncbi:hypothetical protein TSTA_023420 [Talaromyces stipitatus ATCC 10500]|uniref:Uncharacterized protein n=1 Tax=Talaromyces stipitatus (strain ATCC 10500 / CBS 375.48 / QM 6759 / NRRL 1006) TaxID=441959 RepID=B8M607_TALSN|nr:uncharacterized protein TSTA_023420 [Talaromyces stipitatus ATCC 10500]EED19007.1 hypothetical protein TSTA_023420 [Talaromyces stipitatus ATCC 10500]